MALFFPELFCEKGSILQVQKELTFEKFNISVGEKCYVLNIIGSGFDICLLKEEQTIFRVMNSQMRDFFKIKISPVKEKIFKESVDFKVKFLEDFYHDGVKVISKGEIFHYQVDSTDRGRFYELYDDYRKVVRFNEKEAYRYLNFNYLK